MNLITNNLITITTNEQMEQTVSARELHEFLDMDTPFRLWFPRMCEYGFEEWHDYTPYNFVHPQNHQPTTDYQMTIPMAKEVCMIQRNDKGKQARKYFIQVEEAWNDPELVMARSLQYANKKLLGLSETIKALEHKIETDKPKVLFAEAVEAMVDSILIRDMAKLMRKNGIEIGEKRLFGWLRENGFILKYENKPTQKAVELGVLELKEGIRFGTNQEIKPTFTTKVTGKGQVYFMNKFRPQEA